MTTVNCPKCDEQVRLPADASGEARVQCPLCVEEFEMSEVLGQLAPLLVVVHDPAPRSAAATSVAATSERSDEDPVAADQPSGAEFAFAAADSPSQSAPAFAFDEGSSGGSSGSVASRAARTQRPQKSAVMEILKVVGGGVIGLTIGQLILWWVFGSDPLELAPKVPSFASFLVSPKFRANAPSAQGDEPPANSQAAASNAFNQFAADNTQQLPSSSFNGMLGGDPDAANQNGNKNRTKNGNTRNPKKSNQNNGGNAQASANNSAGATPASAASGEETTTGDPLKPLATEEDIFGGTPELDVPMINLQAFPGPGGDQPSGDQPGGDDSTTPPAIPAPTAGENENPPTSPTDDFVGVRNAPQISPDQLADRLSGAVSASIAMDTSDDEPKAERLALARDFYLNLAGLGEAITFVDQASTAEQFQEVGKFALEVGSQPAKVALIGKVAPSWLKNSRPHNGLVVCGTVASIDFQQPYYTTTLVMPNKQELKVISRNDPTADYQPSSQILLLGSILDTPRQNLQGYQGDAETVVLDGLHARLPSPQTPPADDSAEPAGTNAGEPAGTTASPAANEPPASAAEPEPTESTSPASEDADATDP